MSAHRIAAAALTLACRAGQPLDGESECEGVPMLDVCFTPTPLVLDDASGLGIFHDINGSPGIVGTVGNQLYVARLDGNEMNISTAAIDVSIPPSIHVGDFTGDGVMRIVVRDDDADSIHVFEGGMLVGSH